MDAYLHQNKLYPGGNSVNVPVLAKRFGAQKAAYIGVLGDDFPGIHFLDCLDTEGLDVSRVRIVRGITARNLVRLDENGDRHFVGNNGTNVVEHMLKLNLNHDDYQYIDQYNLVHTSVHSFIDEFLPEISRRVPISMDFSDGYNKENIAKLCPLLSFAFFSGGDKDEHEAHALAQYALDCGARTVVVTRGVQGSYQLEKGRSHLQKSITANVIDALGAGDSFIAAFLTSYSKMDGNLSAAAQSASEFAAKCCEYYGAFGNAMELPGDR